MSKELTYSQVNRDVMRPLFSPSMAWHALMALVTVGLAYGAFCWGIQLIWGLGVAGYQLPVSTL